MSDSLDNSLDIEIPMRIADLLLKERVETAFKLASKALAEVRLILDQTDWSDWEDAERKSAALNAHVKTIENAFIIVKENE